MMRARDVANLRHGSKIQLSTAYEEWERGTTRGMSRRREKRWQGEPARSDERCEETGSLRRDFLSPF